MLDPITLEILWSRLVSIVDEAAAGGNRIAQRSYFTRNDGTQGAAVDALLNRLV